MNKSKCWSVALAVLLASGCGPLRREVGSQRVVGRSPSATPDWVGKSFVDQGDHYLYIGVVTNRADMALGLREAKAEGEKKLAEQIRQRIRTEFGSAIEGQNLDGQTGAYVRDLIAKVSDNVEVSGVRMSETYVEKIEETTGSGVRYLYNCHAQLQLEKADYADSRRRVLDGALEKARAATNAKAEDSLRRAMGRLESLPGATPLAAQTADGTEGKPAR